MLGFLNKAANDIISRLDKHVTPDTGLLVVPGGFGKNIYLMDRLRARYKRNGRAIVDSLGDM